MNINASRTAAIEFLSFFLVLPLVIWLALYLSTRWSSVNPRTVLPWLRILRWIGWGLAVAVGILELAKGRFPVYGIVMAGCSAGLALPENWVKRFVPEPIQPHPNK